MSRAAVVLATALTAALASAADSAVELEPMQPNLDDLPSLQRGMALYVNFCLGCHSLKFQRYERTAHDLRIPPPVALDNLVFTGQKIGGLMTTAMPREGAKNWFGAPPPDLTMVDKVRGTAWVYSMLKSFYVDPTRPFGVNNRVFENIGMPHVLVGLQGVQRLVSKGNKPLDILDGAGRLIHLGGDGSHQVGVEVNVDGRTVIGREPNQSFLEVDPGTGSMTAEEYDQAAYDIANFLHYVGEPGRAQRKVLGVWVLAFLAGLFVLATLLNREYWKDVH